MIKISLIVVVGVLHCVVYGQFPVNNFVPYHIPYISIQPTNQQKEETAAQFGGTGEKNTLFQGAIFLQIKRLEASAVSLAKQLSNTQQIVSDLTAALKVAQTELASTKKDVSDLNNELQKKAKQADLVETNTAVSDLNAALKKTNDDLATKAKQADLDTTNNAVSDLKAPKSIGTIPSSCGDLKTIGFVKSGIYSVVADKQVKNVYCDFKKSSGDADFQKLIGYVNVKSTAVYFYAQRTGNYGNVNTGIPFNNVKMNEGSALDISTGEFLAPVSGKYFFAYSGMCHNGEAKIQLQKKTSGSSNWPKIGESHCTAYNPLAIQSTLQLAKGDQVRLYLLQGTTHDINDNNFSNYVGWLLEEDFV